MSDRDLLFMLYGALKATGMRPELIKMLERHLFGDVQAAPPIVAPSVEFVNKPVTRVT